MYLPGRERHNLVRCADCAQPYHSTSQNFLTTIIKSNPQDVSVLRLLSHGSSKLPDTRLLYKFLESRAESQFLLSLIRGKNLHIIPLPWNCDCVYVQEMADQPLRI